MRHQYTRAELESITQETAIYIEGAGIAQLQWGGLEIAEGCRDGNLYCKHIITPVQRPEFLGALSTNRDEFCPTPTASGP